jgi:hypothetical protein
MELADIWQLRHSVAVAERLYFGRAGEAMVSLV